MVVCFRLAAISVGPTCQPIYFFFHPYHPTTQSIKLPPHSLRVAAFRGPGHHACPYCYVMPTPVGIALAQRGEWSNNIAVAQ